jgi:predicted acyl esterase
LNTPFSPIFLKGKGNQNLPDAWVFDTGAEKWFSYDSWPPEDTEEKLLWLEENGRLSWNPPGRDAEAFDEFISDPQKPVPYTAPFLSARSFYNRQYLSEDQRFASTRTDVLVYEGEILEENITLGGPVEVELYVSTTGTDADWVVK